MNIISEIPCTEIWNNLYSGGCCSCWSPPSWTGTGTGCPVRSVAVSAAAADYDTRSAPAATRWRTKDDNHSAVYCCPSTQRHRLVPCESAHREEEAICSTLLFIINTACFSLLGTYRTRRIICIALITLVLVLLLFHRKQSQLLSDGRLLPCPLHLELLFDLLHRLQLAQTLCFPLLRLPRQLVRYLTTFNLSHRALECEPPTLPATYPQRNVPHRLLGVIIVIIIIIVVLQILPETIPHRRRSSGW